MKIRTTNTHHVADARSLGGGEKWFPKTPAGKRQAQAHLRKVQAEYDSRGAYLDPSRSPKFRDAVQEYLRAEEARCRLGEMGQSHLNSKVSSLAYFCTLSYGGRSLGDTRLADFRSGQIKRELLPLLYGGNSHATVKRKFGIFKHFFQWAVEVETLIVSPAAIRLPARRQTGERAVDRISKQAVHDIIAHAAPRYRLAIAFSAYTGLRAGEQLALTWDDIDFDAGLVKVSKAVKKDGSIGGPKTEAGHRAIEIADTLLHGTLSDCPVCSGKGDLRICIAATEVSPSVQCHGFFDGVTKCSFGYPSQSMHQKKFFYFRGRMASG